MYRKGYTTYFLFNCRNLFLVSFPTEKFPENNKKNKSLLFLNNSPLLIIPTLVNLFGKLCFRLIQLRFSVCIMNTYFASAIFITCHTLTTFQLHLVQSESKIFGYFLITTLTTFGPQSSNHINMAEIPHFSEDIFSKKITML